MMLMLVALGAAPATAQSVYSVVKDKAEFSILGDLIDVLNTTGLTRGVFLALNNPSSSLTVFAPTDTAILNYIAANFGTVAEATSNVGFIIELLKYHVVDGKVLSNTLTVDQVVEPMLDGSTFTISSIDPPTITTASGQTVFITNADIPAGESVIHNVSHVLDPKGGAWMFGGETRLMTTLAVATSTKKHGILISVLTALGEPYVSLVTGNVTKLMVVAPDDDAFNNFVKAAKTNLTALLAEPGMTTLKSVIDYHVFYDVSANVQGANGMSPNPLLATSSATWVAGANLTMLNTEDLTVMKSDSKWTLVTSLNQTVTSSLLPTSSGFLMQVTEVLSPKPAAATPDTSGASSYHVSTVTLASALMAVLVMVVAV